MIAIALILAQTGWAKPQVQTLEQKERPVTEWMRGVPSGCRLISLELMDDKSGKLKSAGQVDITWSYAISDDERETTMLVNGVNILQREPIRVRHSDPPRFRITVALTPRRANQLKLAAALGTLELQSVAEQSSQGAPNSAKWDVYRIEDRTELIEAQLRTRSGGVRELQRPTLATGPAQSVAAKPRGLILIPVKSERER